MFLEKLHLTIVLAQSYLLEVKLQSKMNKKILPKVLFHHFYLTSLNYIVMFLRLFAVPFNNELKNLQLKLKFNLMYYISLLYSKTIVKTLYKIFN